MNLLLAAQFKKLLASNDIEAARDIVSKAVAKGYPESLIRSWSILLPPTDTSRRHLYHPTPSPPKLKSSEHRIGTNLREELTKRLAKHFRGRSFPDQKAETCANIIFGSIDYENGSVSLPDLNSYRPESNLIQYSIKEYYIDNPDIFDAVRRGSVLSGMDHLLRNGYLEIMSGRRRSCIVSTEKTKRYGCILYIVDDISKLCDDQAKNLTACKQDGLNQAVLSLQDFKVYQDKLSSLDAYIYFYQKISDQHNMCIMLPCRMLCTPALKWLTEIKLEEKTAIFGHGSVKGSLQMALEFSYSNAILADITNGCIIVNSIDLLTVLNSLPRYQTAYGFYHALVLALHGQNVQLILKNEILSQSSPSTKHKTSPLKTYWSPFYWEESFSQSQQSLLVRNDLLTTWKQHLLTANSGVKTSLNKIWQIDEKKIVVNRKKINDSNLAIIIPFRDKIELLKNCVDSLFARKEDVKFKIYAVNNDSKERQTFSVLDDLKEKYSDAFLCLESKGDFNFSKINNDTAKYVKEEYLLFLNNDTLFESDYALTNLLQTHLFCNAVVTGAKLLYPSGRIQHNGLALTPQKHIAVLSPFKGSFDENNYAFLSDDIFNRSSWSRTHECSAVTAACMLIAEQDFHQVGGFDELLGIAYNDVDLCLRLKENTSKRPIICCTDLRILHLESESRGLDNIDSQKISRLYFERNILVDRYPDLFSIKDRYLNHDPLSDDIYYSSKSIAEKTNSYGLIDLPKSTINRENLYLFSNQNDITANYAAIFVHFNKDSGIDADCIHYLSQLRKHCDIYFVSSSESLAEKPDEIEKIKSLCKQILVRHNSGYDFGCWSHVIKENYQDLINYSGVLLCNDSNLGPLTDFADTFKKIDNNPGYDFYGLTASSSPKWHLQSYFILYTQKLVKSALFQAHWFSIALYKNKFDVIMSYEVNWSFLLRKLGYEGLALYDIGLSADNPTHVAWEKLINHNFPFIKKELLRDNPLNIDLGSLPKLISSYQTPWANYITSYLEQYDREETSVYKALKEMK